jgi:hypothetical protein
MQRAWFRRAGVPRECKTPGLLLDQMGWDPMLALIAAAVGRLQTPTFQPLSNYRLSLA